MCSLAACLSVSASVQSKTGGNVLKPGAAEEGYEGGWGVGILCDRCCREFRQQLLVPLFLHVSVVCSLACQVMDEADLL